MYTYSNFAKSTVQNNPLAIGGTSLTLYTGDGAKFPSSGTFTIVIWGSAHGNPSGDSTAEICTATRSGDVLTLTNRGQEGTSAKEWAQDSNVAHILTAGGIDEIIDSIKNGAIPYDGTMPTFISTTSGVDTISFAGVDVTDEFSPGRYVICSSAAGSNLVYKVLSSSFSTNTTVELVGETSVSGTITAISYSTGKPNGVTEWLQMFNFSAYASTATTLINDTATKVTLATENFDPNSNFASSKYTIPVTGKYIFDFAVACVTIDSATPNSNLFAAIYVNGGERGKGSRVRNSGANQMISVGTRILKLNRGDYVELYGFVVSDGNEDCRAVSTETFLDGAMLSI